LGVSFSEDELVKSSHEPVDVTFRWARFQVMELIDPKRRRNQKIKKWSDKVKNAKGLNDLVERLDGPSRPITPVDLQGVCGQFKVIS
jgi:hypothetical protein